MPWQKKADAPYVVVTDAGFWSVALARFSWLQYLAPTLGGETIDVTTFCARGPEFVPPITMADIIILGPSDDWSRPHTLLAVAHAIAHQEIFARYCENTTGVSCSVIATRVAGAPTQWGTYPEWIFVRQAVPTTALAIRIGRTDGVGTGLGSVDVLNPDNSIHHNIIGTGHTAIEGGRDWWEMPWTGAYWGIHVNGGPPGSTWELAACTEGGSYELPPATARPDIEFPSGDPATLDQLEVKLDFVQQYLSRTAGNRFNLDPTTMSGVGQHVNGELLDAVGLLVTITGIPSWAGRYPDQPDRFRGLAVLQLGNEHGWWPAIEIEHASTNVIPVPLGATTWSLDCMQPMTGAVTLYRPTT